MAFRIASRKMVVDTSRLPCQEDVVMPMHDWTRVEAGIFHAFHHGWIATTCAALNTKLLPPDHYALTTQLAASPDLDILTCQTEAEGRDRPTGLTDAEFFRR